MVERAPRPAPLPNVAAMTVLVLQPAHAPGPEGEAGKARHHDRWVGAESQNRQ